MKTLSNFFDYSSYHPLNYIFSVLLLIIYYRSAAKKIQKLGDYYFAFKEYMHNAHIILKKVNPILLVSFEISAAIMLVFPAYVRFASLLVVTLQFTYLILMFSGEKNITDVNCGCYVTLPRNIDFISILKNLIILFLGLLNFIIFL